MGSSDDESPIRGEKEKGSVKVKRKKERTSTSESDCHSGYHREHKYDAIRKKRKKKVPKDDDRRQSHVTFSRISQATITASKKGRRASTSESEESVTKECEAASDTGSDEKSVSSGQESNCDIQRITVVDMANDIWESCVALSQPSLAKKVNALEEEAKKDQEKF